MESKDNKKKKTTISMIGSIILFILAIIIIFIMLDRIAFVLRNHELPSVISSNEYFVELQVPKSWSVQLGKNQYHWLTTQSKDNINYIKIYTFKFNRRMSNTEFLKYESKLFPKVGKPIESRKIELPWFRKIFGIPYEGVDRIYKVRGNDKLMVRYITSSTYAYAVVASSSSNNIEPLQKMLNYDLTIFNKHVVYADIKNILNNYHEIMIWVIGAAIAFAFWIIIGFLGKTGWSIRTARERIKLLYDIKIQSEKSKETLNNKYYRLLFKARVIICFIVSTWAVFYALGFYLLGKKAIILLALLIVPILGYFGLRFGPSDDPDDWAH